MLRGPLRALAVAIAAAGLAACATAGAREDGHGYSETQIAENRARVAFRGNTLMSRSEVEDMVLYRAAELTLARGYDHFIVAARKTETYSRLQGYGGRAYSLAPRGWPYPAQVGWRSWYQPLFKSDVAYRQITEFTARAEIAMHHGPRPDDPAAFDAREVEARLAERVAAWRR
jgi:hypothetical protein